MANSILYPQMYDVTELARYTSATTLDYLVLKGANQEVHYLVDDADPNGDTIYDEAPVGSIFIRVTAGSVTSYIKSNATTWTEQT